MKGGFRIKRTSVSCYTWGLRSRCFCVYPIDIVYKVCYTIVMVEVEAIGMGFNVTGYPGAFTPKIHLLISGLVSPPTLHLFSGQSLIGDERVDLEHPNATCNCAVEVFIANDDRQWEFVILDPPYGIDRVKTKLREYGRRGAIGGNVALRRMLKRWLGNHTQNILWLDQCAPMVEGFWRRKLWLVLPGGHHNVRVLSFLVKEGGKPCH